MLIVFALLTAAPRSFGAFGLTDNGTEYVVDTGGGLVFKVVKSDGNIDSWVYNGTEYNGPSGKGSEIASGLGSTGTTVTGTNLGNIIQVTIQTSSANTVCSNFTHYFIVTNGVNNVYMADYLTSEPGVGEFRWITRLAYNLLPNGPTPSDNNGNTGAIESSDVFGHADGTTTSKYYGNGVSHGKDRAIDMTYSGATGNNVGCWMVFDNRESSAGGPFYRDIENQGDGANSDQEVYNYMNSGHAKIEAWRMNVLYGPYVLVWNNGTAPTLPIDMSWIGNLGLTGWVSASGRGTVSGTASGLASGVQGVVGLANTTAQYWGNVDQTGNYSISGVKPGTYTAYLYEGELGVASNSVTVTAGSTSTLNLASTWPTPSTVFQIGDWDGTPQGFMNATNILGFSYPNFISMHPSDVRMNTWGSANTFNVGTDPISIFPSILMRGTNSHTYINFNLTSGQITNLTFKIGSTCSYNGGRPDVKINGHDLGYPAAPTWTGTRVWTVGTYRGYNILWTWSVPLADLIAGQNQFDISAVSGSTDSSPFLSAGWVYDAVELDGPSGGGSSNTNPPPAPTGLTATAGNNQVALSWTASSGATSYNVYRSITSGSGYTSLAAGVTSTSYTDTTAANGTTYYYVVTAVNANGESAYSNEASATPQAPQPPPAPTGLTATAGNNQVALNWTASSGATSYNVKRATVSGGPYTTIGTSTTTSYTDTTAVNGTTYYYVVSAVNANGESANSSEVSATPSAPVAPNAPTNLAASSPRKHQVALTWTQSSSANITNNKIYRATTSGGPYSLVTTIAAATSYTDSSLTTGTTYYYVVTAVNSSGVESAYSNQASATSK